MKIGALSDRYTAVPGLRKRERKKFRDHLGGKSALTWLLLAASVKAAFLSTDETWLTTYFNQFCYVLKKEVVNILKRCIHHVCNGAEMLFT